jgi:molybdenum cofactor synthesis domain-containing protein
MSDADEQRTTDNGRNRRLPIHILTVGREILTGRTLDRNANWLCRRIYALGGRVDRLVTVDDRVTAIRDALKWGIDAGANLMITSGGLGPTGDDVTLEGVALATERPLETHHDAMAFVTEKYESFFKQGAVDAPELTPQRQKMAILPSGAEMLPNRVGAAPGVWLETERGVLVCLPGVPSELQAIFEDHLEDRVRNLLGSNHRLERMVLTQIGDESVLDELVQNAMKRVPGVYMKTLPRTFGPDIRLQVRLEAAGREPGEVENRLRQAESALQEEVERWEKPEKV